MKKFLLTTVFASALIAGTAVAQETPAKNQEAHGQREKMTPEQQADKETARAEKELTLSADQKTKFHSLALTRINTVQPLREKMRAPETTNADQKTMMGQMKAARDTFDKDVNAMLTPEQQTKWAQMKEERKDKAKEGMKEHRGGKKGEGSSKE